MSGLLPRDHWSSGRNSSGSSSSYYPTGNGTPRQSVYGDHSSSRRSSHADPRDHRPSIPSRLRQSRTAYDDPYYVGEGWPEHPSSRNSSFSTVRPSSRTSSFSTHAEPTRRLFPENSYHTPPRRPSYHSSQASARSSLSFDPYREPSNASSSTWGPRSSLSSDPFWIGRRSESSHGNSLSGSLSERRPSQYTSERRPSQYTSERRPSGQYASERRPSSFLPDRRPSFFERSFPDRDPYGRR